MTSLSILCALLIVTISILSPQVEATLSKSDKKNKKSTKSSKKSTEVVNVLERKLVVFDLKPDDILKHHQSYCDAEKEKKRFSGPTLGYVTPWNSRGYDIAKIFHKKFTHVSPVWLQIKVKSDGYQITGTHDIDKGWVKEVIRGGKNSMVPRVLFDGWNMNDYNNLFNSEKQMKKCAKTLTKFLTGYEFSGIVLEFWSQLPQSVHSDAAHFLIHLSESLHSSSMSVILVVPPLSPSTVGSQAFSRKYFDELKDHIDYFSVMTYDYQNQVGRAAPVSPISWVEKTITTLCPVAGEDRRKLLLGINFYGMKYSRSSGAQPVIGHQFIDILKSGSTTVRWNEEEAEHVYEYTDSSDGGHVYLYYPSLLFVKQRLDLATRLGTGIAIWEIGQGLDYFYDLL